MKNILEKKQFIVNNSGEKVGVVLDLDTFTQIESFYEDFVLGRKMDKAKRSKSYTLKEASKKLKYEDT